MDFHTEDQRPCHQRDDSAGLLNGIKAWWPFFVHIAACLLFTLIMVFCIDGKAFQTGSPPVEDLHHLTLHQTTVSGLVSLALLFIRTVTTTASTLIVWRLIDVLLKECSIRRNEILRLVNRRIPIMPNFKNRLQTS